MRTAIETQTNHTALQALLEIAMIEKNEGNPELALELLTHCLHHPSTRREVTERAESPRTEWAAQLTPQQIEAAEARARTTNLLDLAQATLAAG